MSTLFDPFLAENQAKTDTAVCVAPYPPAQCFVLPHHTAAHHSHIPAQSAPLEPGGILGVRGGVCVGGGGGCQERGGGGFIP